mgnify:CR=1 FL=1
MAILDTEPIVDPFQVLLHRSVADVEDRADLRIRFALRNPSQDFCFPSAQPKLRHGGGRWKISGLIQYEEVVLPLLDGTDHEPTNHSLNG